MAADILIRKGKRGTAAYIQTACNTENNPNVFNDLLDIFLDPTKPIDDWDMLDWCRWIIAGGKTPDEYAQTVRRYDNATTCGLVWTTNFVAYRCRTCGISPCMSLCSDCFQRGNHEGHDFNMFRSQAGGACDCGDKSVMKESGFCHKHIPKLHLDKLEAPHDLLCVAKAFMPRAFLRLIQHLRECYKSDSLDKHLTAIQEADGLLNMLHQHSELGAAMREVMTHALTNPQIYSNLAKNCESSKPEKSEYLTRNFQAYKDAVRCPLGADCSNSGDSKQKIYIRKPRETKWKGFEEELDDLKKESDTTHHDLKHSTFLDELVFWTVKYEFPQKLVCMLLNMMPDLNYKEAFTRTFVHHYTRIGKMLAHSSDLDTLSNRVVHVSVQLFSNEDLAFQMTKHFALLHVMVKSLNDMMAFISMPSTLQCPERNFHLVVDCSHRIMKEHCYWPLVSDLNNVLTHRPVALEFLSDSKLLNMWFSFLSLFQGMNVNQRELKVHVEFESNTYYAAFSAELEASATPMWALILHLKDSDTLNQSQNVLKECLKAIKRWLHAIGFLVIGSLGETINPYQVSFHLPLHRCFASFLCQAVRHQGMKLSEIIPDEDDLKLIMMHPLQAQVAFHEILAGMWVRCGLQIKGQAMTYIQCHFCNSIVDADLFLLQLCVMFLDPNWFLKTVMQRFHVWEWFTFHPNRINSFLESEQVLPMLESALTFITTLITTHTNIGKTEEQVTRQEMVSLLCMSDRTHSQLIDLLPDKCGSTSQNKDFESILTQVADYKAPNFEVSGTMVQGTYVPKMNIWEEEYDPIHILLRAVHRREYQASLDRFSQCLRQSGKYTGQGTPWPPYRIPGPVHPEFKDPRIILHSKTMHGLIFTILFRALNDPDVPEQILALCIYLLDMAVRFPNEKLRMDSSISVKDDVDLNFSDWFPGNDTLTNITVPIKRIIITEKVVMGMVEEMEVEEEEEEMDTEVECLSYQVQSPVISEEDNIENISLPASLPQTNPPLALPSSNTVTALVPVESSNEELVNRLLAIAHQDARSSISNNSNMSSTSSSTTNSAELTTSLNMLQLPTGNNVDMAIVPTSFGFTTMRPRCLKLKEIPGSHRMLLTDQGLPQVAFQSSENTSNDAMKAMPFCSKRLVEINESILSLLIALYSKLCGKPDAYKIPSESNQSSDQNQHECRIGNGVDFICRLIDRIVQSGLDKEVEVQKICQRLWPKSETSAASFKPSDTVDKEERRRKARERQQKLMAEFASKQKAFLQKTMEAETNVSGADDSNSNEMLTMRKEYECVICGQTTVSEEERPMGMIVLLQATSVLGHSHQEHSSARYLPCSDEERFHFQKEKTLAYYMSKRFSQLSRHFDNKYWQLAVNIGWEGGVHVQSCGHYLHIDCHKSYIQSLKCQNQQSTRHQNLNVERGEYACPLCRQLANSVIPLNPAIGETGGAVCCWGKNLYDLGAELSQLMTSSLSERESNLMKIHMHSIMEDLTNATYPQYRSVCSPNSSSLFLFLCSIARTNLEIELIQRNGGSTSIAKQKPCFVPLLHVLSMHSRVLTQSVPTQIWTQLTGQTSDNMYSVTLIDTEVPLLLRDCVAILLQIILTLPLNIDKVYFHCVVQVLYNVVYIRAVTQLSVLMSQKQRMQWKQSLGATCENSSSWTYSFTNIFKKVIDTLEPSSLYLKDEDMDLLERVMEWTEEGIEHYIQDLCLHFLQIASLLQSHLYPEPTFDLNEKNQLNEFGSLCVLLGLTSSENPEKVTSVSCLKWATINPSQLIQTWCFDFMEFVNSASHAARKFLRGPMIWYPPALLKLPENYDQIFQYYHRRPCSVCHSVPKDPSLCLVCGTMVCLRENCCRQQAQYEAVLHSVACGAGTAMYLAVNSSTIIVIRGKRACLWGSVYLDSFGEEDRDLKRGKPLFLSKERYDLLQNQWLNHGFNHTNKRWVWHKDNL